MKISMASATSLSDISESTFRRRISDGVLVRTIEDGPNGRSMLPFDLIRPDCCIPIDEQDIAPIMQADMGNANAQTDVALLLLSHARPKKAIYWLELAAKQRNAEAMHWLGRCYIEGNGVPQDENLGLMWLSKAAAEGQPISQEIMAAIREKIVRPDPTPNRIFKPTIA